MSLRVEYELVQVDFVLIVTEQQVEIFERLTEPESFHHVLWSRVEWTFDVSNRCVAVRDFRVLLEGLKNVPPHILVSFIASDGVEVVETFNELRPQQVVSVIGLNVNVRRALALEIEVGDFRRQVSRLFHVRLIACFEQFIRQRQVRLRHSILVPQQKSSRQVARQMIHLRLEVLSAN